MLEKFIDQDFEADGCLDWPSESEYKGVGAVDFPDSLLIDRVDWPDWIRENEKNRASSDHFSPRITSQGSSHLCVSFASVVAFQCVYNKQLGGKQHSVWLSPLSLYTRATGGRERGGSNVLRTLEEMKTGILPDHDGPQGHNTQRRKFEHTLHETSGRSEDWWPTRGFVTPSELPTGWESTAKHFRVLEYYRIDGSDIRQHISAVLRGWVCVNGRAGHSVPHTRICFKNGRILSQFQDSYRRNGWDSERMLRGAGGYVIRSVTLPEDRCCLHQLGHFVILSDILRCKH